MKLFRRKPDHTLRVYFGNKLIIKATEYTYNIDGEMRTIRIPHPIEPLPELKKDLLNE